MNDHAPKFSQDSYALSVTDELELGKSLLKVMAVDVDDGSNGKVSYDIQDGQDANL